MAKYLDSNGLAYFWDKIKAYIDAVIQSVGAITGVKGDAEATYRVGNVNLTPGNIGAAAASHTHTESDISDFGSYLPTAGGEVTGNLIVDGSINGAKTESTGILASSDNQTAIGKYNDNQSGNAFEIGNGTDDSNRSNALAVEWNGNVEMGPRLTLEADSNNTGALRFQSDNRFGEFVKLYGGADEYGDAVVIGDGGCVVIGSGESAVNVYAAESMTPGSEIMAITSDTYVDLYSNCNTIANRCKFRFGSGGDMQVIPMKFDMSLADNGASQSYWGGSSSTGTYWPGYRILDRSGRVSSYFGSSIATNGSVSSGMWVYNYDASGSMVANASFGMHMSKSGSVSYSVPNPPAFVNAIGIAAYGALTGQSSTITLNGGTAAANAKKVPFSSFAGQYCSADSNGIKVQQAGVYMIWASVYFSNYYDNNSLIHVLLYKTTSAGTRTMIRDYHQRIGTYTDVSVAPMILTLAANDTIHVWAYNQSAAKGEVSSNANGGLFVKRIL